MIIKINKNKFEVFGTESERKYMNGSIRNVIRIHFSQSSLPFEDNCTWSIIDKDVMGQEVEYDKSFYCLVGDKVKHQDNTNSIYMCAKTEEEKIQEVENNKNDLIDIIDALS